MALQTVPIEIVVAVDEEGGFGKEGKIPWNIPEDLKHFKQLTENNSCVMGRVTYEDMLKMKKSRSKKKNPTIKQILPNRNSYVITSNPNYDAPGATVAPNLRNVVQSIKGNNQILFVIGGYNLFIEGLTWADKIHMTIVKGNYQCDRFFPIHTIRRNFEIVAGEEKDNLYFVTYQRVR